MLYLNFLTRPACASCEPTIPTRTLVVLACVAMAGCATTGGQETKTPPPEYVETPAPNSGPSAERRIYGTAQAFQNIAQTLFVDPFLRPFSTASAAGAVLIKTSGSTIRRTVSSTARAMHAADAPPPVIASTPMDLDAWERELDSLVDSPTSTGRVSFLIDGEEFFPRLSSAIRNARQHVHSRTYIFDNDDFSVSVADLLRKRSAEIDVRVLLDGVGTLLGTLVDSSGTPADFAMPLSMPRYLEDDSEVRVRTQSNPFMTGDHVKSTIVDGKVAFVGGMNIGREYHYEWHDMMVEVTGPVVQYIQRDFDKAWSKTGLLGDLGLLAHSLKRPRRMDATTGYAVRVLKTLPHDSQIYRAQLAAIRRARSYIFIENPYFADDVILHELIAARHRGVDVRVILPAEGNHPMLNLSNSVAINTMLARGVRIYLYPGMSHIKAAVFDGWACVGSANLDQVSLRINREMNLATSDPSAVADLLERLFAADFRASREVTSPVQLTWQHSLAELLADVAL